MKKLLIGAMSLAVVVACAGCSDDDTPTGSGGTPTDTPTSTWDEDGQFWRSTVDAVDSITFRGFSFTTQDTITTGVPKPFAEVWDIAFRREIVKLNGGSSTENGGDVMGADLGVVDFSGVTIADTTGVEWTADNIGYFINNWYDYNPNTHALTANRNVYSMVDATGDHYLKFQIDSMVGAGQPPDMGTIYMKYFYQSVAGSKDLSGTVQEISFLVGPNPTYFDFSAGAVSTPGDPATSLDWDLKFYAYELIMNNQPTGAGNCLAFFAFDELNDPTDIEVFQTQPDAPMFHDNASSIMHDWYTYTGPPMHQLLSNDNVYLIKTGDKVYKMKIESYYINVSGSPTSRHYTFVWAEL